MFKYWDKCTLRPKDLVYFAIIFLFLEWVISLIFGRSIRSSSISVVIVFITFAILEVSTLFSTKQKEQSLNDKD